MSPRRATTISGSLSSMSPNVNNTMYVATKLWRTKSAKSVRVVRIGFCRFVLFVLPPCQKLISRVMARTTADPTRA